MPGGRRRELHDRWGCSWLGGMDDGSGHPSRLRGGEPEHRMSPCLGHHGRLRAQHMQREHSTSRAGRLIVGVVPGVVSKALYVGGQAKTAALREGSNRDPALGENGERYRKSPSPPTGRSCPQGGSQHPFLMVHPHTLLRTSEGNATLRASARPARPARPANAKYHKLDGGWRHGHSACDLWKP